MAPTLSLASASRARRAWCRRPASRCPPLSARRAWLLGLAAAPPTMSAAKENPCRKFQANIFNKSKCQNCFKPRESHLLNDEDLTQVSGWGCPRGAPETVTRAPRSAAADPGVPIGLKVPGPSDAPLGVARSRPRRASASQGVPAASPQV